MLFLKTCLTHRFSKFVLVVCNNSHTVDPPLMAASPQRPFFLANSPYTDSCFNLSATVTSLQWPLSSVPKVAFVEQTTSSLSFFYSPSSKMRDTQMAARVTDGARWQRQEKRFFFLLGLPPSFRASHGFASALTKSEEKNRLLAAYFRGFNCNAHKTYLFDMKL